MIDHDRLFKEPLTTFFVEFMELFLPDAAAFLQPDSVTFLDKEVFTDVTSGDKHNADLVAHARFRGQEAFFLFHVEHQDSRKNRSPGRMFRYFARFYEKYNLPIYPVVIFSFKSPLYPQPDFHRVEFPGWVVMEFHFRVIQLNRLDWRDFLRRENPVAAALMAKMKMQPGERKRVKYECLRLMATLRIDPARMKLIAGFVDTYLTLNAREEHWVQDKIEQLEPKARKKIMDIMTSWERKGLEQGLQQGKAELVARLAGVRFGRLPVRLERGLARLSSAQLDELGEALLEMRDLKELKAWLEQAKQEQSR